MRISFDLDGTLLVDPGISGLEKALPIPWCWFYPSTLRQGTLAMMESLQSRGHELWIYSTADHRSVGSIRGFFRHYGIRLQGVVNQSVHRSMVTGRDGEPAVSKYPPKFGIDLHIDDEPAVKQDGDAYGFSVELVRPEDQSWVNKIMLAVKKLEDQAAGNSSAKH